MSDPFFGTTGSGVDAGENPTAAIIIDTKSVTDAVNVVRAASKAMESYLKNLDASIKAIEASFKLLGNASKISLLEAKKAASDAAAAASKARTQTVKAQGVNQANQQQHQQTMKNLQLQGQAANHLHSRYIQNSRVRAQTSKQNHQLVIQNLRGQSQAQTIVHQQQMAALRSTMALQRQQHQLTMQNLRMQAAGARGGGGGGGGLGGILGNVGGMFRGLGGGGAGAAGGIAGMLGAFAGGSVVGIAASTIRGLVEGFTQVVAASDEVARAYDRQELAGRTLAGSQQELNELMAIYDKATGEALSKSKQMQNVVRLQAVGFADSRTEIDQFSRAIRGISLAIGEPADYVTQNLILELFSMRGQRLDQLGLQYDKVRERQEELMSSDASLTKQQAYQMAVLDQALARYGQLSTSIEGQATGVESLAAAWDDFGLAMAQWIQGPANGVMKWLADITQAAADAVAEMSKVHPEDIEYPNPEGGIFSGLPGGDSITRSEAQAALDTSLVAKARLMQDQIDIANGNSIRSAENVARDLATVEKNIRAAQRTLAVLDVQEMRRSGYRDTTPGGGTYNDNPQAVSMTAEQLDEIRDFSRARAELEADTNQAIIDENREYASKRVAVEAEFQQKMSEEAADFARKRARDIAEFEEDIAEATAEAAQRRLNVEKDLQKTIARMNRDYARQTERENRDHNKRLEEYREDAKKDEQEEEKNFAEEQEEARKDHAERVVELEEDFGRDREKAQRAHNESILQAASRLDAAAVFWEQKKFARERKEAEEEHARKIQEEKETLEEELSENQKAHQERMAEIRENLKEQIDEENEAHETRVADAKEAHDQQLKDQIDAANERLTEIDKENFERLEKMKKDFNDRLIEEDIERGIRISREVAHHNDQLSEMDRVHGERITQIGVHAQAERDELDRQHRQTMLDLGFHHAAWEEVERRENAQALQRHKIFLLEDRKLEQEARLDKLKADLANPMNSPEEIARLLKQKEYIEGIIGSIIRNIDNANTVLENLPKPEDVLADKGVIDQAIVSGESKVDLGMWSGKTSQPIVGAAVQGSGTATSITIQSGAIVINTLPGQTQANIGDDFEERLLRTLKKVAKTG